MDKNKKTPEVFKHHPDLARRWAKDDKPKDLPKPKPVPKGKIYFPA